MAHLSKKRLVILGAGGVLALGLAAPAVAYAADSSPAPSSSSSAPAAHRGPDQGEFAKALAKELGVDEQKVSDALTKVREQLKPSGAQKDGKKPDVAERKAKLKERLGQAVKDGKLTQAEVDAITKAADAGVLMGGGPGGHR